MARRCCWLRHSSRSPGLSRGLLIASLTVHDRKRRISDVLPSRPAAPIPGLTTHAGRPNLTVLLGRVLPLPATARCFGVRLSSVADPRTWNRARRPVAGLRLRLADPAGAEPVLRAWLPQASDPAQP